MRCTKAIGVLSLLIGAICLAQEPFHNSLAWRAQQWVSQSSGQYSDPYLYIWWHGEDATNYSSGIVSNWTARVSGLVLTNFAFTNFAGEPKRLNQYVDFGNTSRTANKQVVMYNYGLPWWLCSTNGMTIAAVVAIPPTWNEDSMFGFESWFQSAESAAFDYLRVNSSAAAIYAKPPQSPPNGDVIQTLGTSPFDGTVMDWVVSYSNGHAKHYTNGVLAIDYPTDNFTWSNQIVFFGPHTAGSHVEVYDLMVFTNSLDLTAVSNLHWWQTNYYGNRIQLMANNWAGRVVANGGSAPSGSSKNAVFTFLSMVDSAGLLSKMKALNGFAPDGLIAGLTPQVQGDTYPLWTNHGFLAADLTTNGLKGGPHAGSNYVDTGFVPNLSYGTYKSYFDSGITLYVSEPDAGSSTWDLVLTDGVSVNNGLYWCFAGKTYAYMWDSGSGGINATLDIGDTGGYVSAERLPAAGLKLYRANSTHTHAIFGSGGTDSGTPLGIPFWLFTKNLNSADANWSSKTYAFVAFTDGLTEANSSNFFNCIQTLRTNFGGGYK